jgi:hypothetical protein
MLNKFLVAAMERPVEICVATIAGATGYWYVGPHTRKSKIDFETLQHQIDEIRLDPKELQKKIATK